MDHAKVEDDLLPADEHSSASLPVYTILTCNWEGTVREYCAIQFPQGAGPVPYHIVNLQVLKVHENWFARWVSWAHGTCEDC